MSSESLNVSDLCRLCLSTEGSLISVLELIEESELLLEKIYTCLLVEILESDEISRKVCQSCLDKVDNFYSFRHLVSDSQEELGRLLAASREESISSTYPQNVDDIDVELERELDGKENDCWEAGDNLVDDVICDVERLSEPSERLQSGDDDSQEKLNLDHSKQSYLKKPTQLSSPQNPVPPEPGGFSLPLPDESILEGLDHDSLPFCVHQEEKSEDPLDLRCNISSESTVLESFSIKEKTKHSKVRHRCSGCSKTFSSLQSLLKHINKHHSKNQNHVCHKCNIGFKTSEQLKVHNWGHKEKYECDKCPYSSYSLGNFKLHVMKHNCEFLVVCEECGKGFYRVSSYEEHKANKHGQDIVVHKCNECGKAYHSRGYLRQHLKTHAPDFSRNDYQCETCGKTFLSWKGIRRHMASAHEGNRYKCDVCSKEVTSLQSLRTHKKIHTGEKSYVCDTCGKAFLRLNSLIVHRRVHSGEKPYVCDVCEKCFSQRSTLNVHKRSHTGERPYPCHLCTKSFVTKTLRNSHLKTHEPLSFN